VVLPDRVPRNVRQRTRGLFLHGLQGGAFQSFFVGRDLVTLRQHAQILDVVTRRRERPRQLIGALTLLMPGYARMSF
jgi:hypothetical protein